MTEQKTRFLGFHIDLDIARKLKVLAAKKDISLSKLLKEIIREYVERSK